MGLGGGASFGRRWGGNAHQLERSTPESLEMVRRFVEEAERVVVLTGAGISTDSGIPDFRGKNGVWTKDPEAEKLSTIGHYMSSVEIRKRAWQWRIDAGLFDREPNAGHQALVDLESMGKLDLLITQNVDGLHVKAGTDPELLVEIHGTVSQAQCMSCRWRGPIDPVLERVRAGDMDPACDRCKGVLKTATVMFGEDLDPEGLERSFTAADNCDLLLAVGTSLTVGPINEVVPRAATGGARVVILNRDRAEFERMVDVVIHAGISDTLPLFLAPTPPSERPLRFSPAGVEDVAPVVDLVQSAYRGESSRAGWTTEADLIEGQRVDRDMVRALIDGPDAMVLTARTDDDNEIVACCELQHRRSTNSAYLGMFAVRPTMQSGGLGRRVLEEAERLASDSWNVSHVTMSVIENRVELIDWYRRRGYELTGESQPFPYGDERFGIPTRSDLQFVVLRKKLSPSS